MENNLRATTNEELCSNLHHHNLVQCSIININKLVTWRAWPSDCFSALFSL